MSATHRHYRRRKSVRATLPLLAAVVASGTWSSAAVAKDADFLDDPFYISLGTYILATDTKLQVNGRDLVGDKINLEKTFGDADTNRFRVDGYWRFADRHKLRFVWFDWNATRQKTIKEDIEFDGEVFPAEARVRYDGGFAVYELAYEYAFLRRENYELTGSFGIHYTELSYELKASLDVNGDPIGDGALKGSASVDAPLPVFGLRALWNIGGDFWLDASAQYFALSIDEYDGNLQDYRVAVTWQPRKYLGVGLGYNAFSVNVDVDKDRFDGSLDWTYRGPQIFYSASF